MKKRNHRVFAALLAAALSVTSVMPAAAAEFTAETVETTDGAEGESEPALSVSEENTPEEAVFGAEEDVFSAGETPEAELFGEDAETPEEPEEAPAFVSQDGTSYEYVSEMNCYKLTAGEDMEEVKIPEKLYGRQVSIIGKGAFKNCTNLKTFSLEGWGRMIIVEQSAFEGCTNLRSVHLPDGFHLESKAFRKCPKLFLFDGGEGALQVESTFEEDTFDADTKAYFRVGEYGYSSEMRQLMKKLGILLIGEIDTNDRKDYAEGVTYLKESHGTAYAADFDDSRRDAKIDSSHSEPLTVRRRAFYGTGVEEVVLSEKVKAVEGKAFYGCKKLKKIVIPDTVTSIAKDAFNGASKAVIYTPKGSYAQKYAKKNGISCKTYATEKIKAPEKLGYTRSKNKITLEWSNVFCADKYQIYKYNSTTGKYAKIATVKNGSQHTYAVNLQMGETAKYKVRAYSTAEIYKDNYGPFSPVVTVKSVPDEPVITSASNNKPGCVTIKWKGPKDATGYMVYRSEISAYGETVQIAKLSKKTLTSYTDFDVESGKRYYYRVRAYRKDGTQRVCGYLGEPVSVKVK